MLASFGSLTKDYLWRVQYHRPQAPAAKTSRKHACAHDRRSVMAPEDDVTPFYRYYSQSN